MKRATLMLAAIAKAPPVMKGSRGRGGMDAGRFPFDLDTIDTFGYGHPRSLILLDALRIRVLAWKPT